MKFLKSLMSTGLLVGASMFLSGQVYGQAKADVPDYQETTYETFITQVNPMLKQMVMDHFNDFTDAELHELHLISRQTAAVSNGKQAALLHERTETWMTGNLTSAQYDQLHGNSSISGQ